MTIVLMKIKLKMLTIFCRLKYQKIYGILDFSTKSEKKDKLLNLEGIKQLSLTKGGIFVKKIKEPIKNWKIWIVLIVLYIMSVPWYFPEGSYNPIILGVPYWAIIIMGVSLTISITLTYILKNCWQMADEEEIGEEKE